jgi:hypothetical protein
MVSVWYMLWAFGSIAFAGTVSLLSARCLNVDVGVQVNWDIIMTACWQGNFFGYISTCVFIDEM